MAAAKRDQVLDHRNSSLKRKNDAKVSNIVQAENYRRQIDNEQLQRDLAEQIA